MTFAPDSNIKLPFTPPLKAADAREQAGLSHLSARRSASILAVRALLMRGRVQGGVRQQQGRLSLRGRQAHSLSRSSCRRTSSSLICLLICLRRIMSSWNWQCAIVVLQVFQGESGPVCPASCVRWCERNRAGAFGRACSPLVTSRP